MPTGRDLRDKVLKIVASGLPEKEQLELIKQVLLDPSHEVDVKPAKRRQPESQPVRDS